MKPSLSKSYLHTDNRISLWDYLHVEDELKFCVQIRVVNLEKAMDKLFQIDVALTFQVHHVEQTLANYTR
jgi:hypothetical protein